METPKKSADEEIISLLFGDQRTTRVAMISVQFQYINAVILVYWIDCWRDFKLLAASGIFD